MKLDYFNIPYNFVIIYNRPYFNLVFFIGGTFSSTLSRPLAS